MARERVPEVPGRAASSHRVGGPSMLHRIGRAGIHSFRIPHGTARLAIIPTRLEPESVLYGMHEPCALKMSPTITAPFMHKASPVSSSCSAPSPGPASSGDKWVKFESASMPLPTAQAVDAARALQERFIAGQREFMRLRLEGTRTGGGSSTGGPAGVGPVSSAGEGGSAVSVDAGSPEAAAGASGNSSSSVQVKVLAVYCKGFLELQRAYCSAKVRTLMADTEAGGSTGGGTFNSTGSSTGSRGLPLVPQPLRRPRRRQVVAAARKASRPSRLGEVRTARRGTSTAQAAPS